MYCVLLMQRWKDLWGPDGAFYPLNIQEAVIDI